jgi:dTDP-4-amino-4,6-dideoxygalactose transaminase
MLDTWNDSTIRHAHLVNERLAGVPGVRTPRVPAGSRHVYYQYCLYVPDRDSTVRRCIRRGVDLETLHVDICPSLPLFAAEAVTCPGAERAAQAVQVPIHAALSDRQIERIGRTVRRVVERDVPAAPLESGVNPTSRQGSSVT